MELVGQEAVEEISLGTVVNILEDAPSTWCEQVAFARQLKGINHVELWLEFIPTGSSLEQLGDLVDGLDLTVHAPFVDVNLSSQWNEMAQLSLRKTQAALSVANLLGAHVFTIHSGKCAVYEERDTALRRLASQLRQLRQETDVIVAVENVKAKRSGVSLEVVARSVDVERLLEIQPDARITIDVAHAVQNGDDPWDVVERFGGHIASVHVHDVRADGRSHAPLGTGRLHLNELGAAMSSMPARFLTLETLGEIDTKNSWETLSRLAISGTVAR